MITDQDPQDRLVDLVEEEITERLAFVWTAFLIGESREVQQRLIDDCASFLFSQLQSHDIAQMIFRHLGPEAERRARYIVSQIPRTDDKPSRRIIISYEQDGEE